MRFSSMEHRSLVGELFTHTHKIVHFLSKLSPSFVVHAVKVLDAKGCVFVCALLRLHLFACKPSLCV